MLSKLLVSSLLALSLACFGQVTNTGGYATTSGPAVAAVPVSAANAPLVATPHIALPGNGPAPGAPISSDNDSRFSSGPSVANPNVITSTPSENALNGAAAGINTQTTSTVSGEAANTPQFEFGIQEFSAASRSPRSPVTSLGEIARYYRTHRKPAVRTFNNDSIAQLTTSGWPIGTSGIVVASGASPASATSTTSNSPTTSLIAQNRPPALPQSDQETQSAQSTQTVPRTSATAEQQRHASVKNATTQDSSAAPKTNPAPNSTTPTNTAKLPQTGSSLPLLLLLGGVGLAGGMLWLLRR